MTNAEFVAKYTLLKRVTTDGVRTYNGHQLAPRRVVMAHFLDPASVDESQAMLARLQQLSPVDGAKILDIVDVDGTTVVVTKYLEGFTTLGAWLDARLRGRPQGGGAPEAGGRKAVGDAESAMRAGSDTAPHASSTKPGEFTQYFAQASSSGASGSGSPAENAADAAEKSATVPAPPASASESGAPASPTQAASPTLAPGEFTREFLLRARDAPSAPPLEGTPPPTSSGNAAHEAGDRSVVQRPSPTAPPSAGTASQEEERKPVSREEVPKVPPRGAAEVFERVVLPVASLPLSAPPPLPTSRDDDGSDQPRPIASPQDVMPSGTSAPPAPSQWREPSPYTRVISAGGASLSGVPPLRGEPTRDSGGRNVPAPRRVSYVPLIVLLTVVFLAAIGLILYFVPKH